MGAGRYFIVEAVSYLSILSPSFIQLTGPLVQAGCLCGGLTGFEWSSGVLATVFTSWSLSARLCPLITVMVSQTRRSFSAQF